MSKNIDAKQYHVLFIGKNSDDIRTMQYHLYHALDDTIGGILGMDEKMKYMRADPKIMFHRVKSFNRFTVAVEAIAIDLVVILREDRYLKSMVQETKEFISKQRQLYDRDLTQKIITCAYDRSEPYTIDTTLTLPTYKIALYPEDRGNFYADIRNIMGIQKEKEENEDETNI